MTDSRKINTKITNKYHTLQQTLYGISMYVQELSLVIG